MNQAIIKLYQKYNADGKPSKKPPQTNQDAFRRLLEKADMPYVEVLLKEPEGAVHFIY